MVPIDYKVLDDRCVGLFYFNRQINTRGKKDGRLILVNCRR